MRAHIHLTRTLFLYSMVAICACSSGDKKKNVEKKVAPVIVRVNIRNMKFEPAELVIHRNDTVLWTNQDMVAHDVTETVSGAWSSGKLEPGASWKTTITQSGDYYCSIHVVMTGHITVKE